MARPTKLDQDLQARLCQRLRARAFAEQAARSVGIAPSTYHAWLARGRKVIAAAGDDVTEIPDEDAPFVAFVEAVDAALAEAEIHATTIVRAAMPADWRAAAWYLERRHPDRWRRRAAGELDANTEDQGAEQAPEVAVGDESTTQAAHDFLKKLAAAR